MVLVICDLELPGSNPALGTLKFSRSVLPSLEINDGLASYSKARLTSLTTHVITFHSVL